MRVAECPICHEEIEAETDEELFRKGRAHANEKHADQQFTDEQIRSVPSREK